MLVVNQTFYFSPYILPRDAQGRFLCSNLLKIFRFCCLVFNFISACPRTSGDPKQYCRMPVGNAIQSLWHCCTNGDVVLAAPKAFEAALLSEQILKYFSSLTSVWILYAQVKITYTSAWKTVAYFHTEILSLLPEDDPQIPATSFPFVLYYFYNNEPLNWGHEPQVFRSTLL